MSRLGDAAYEINGFVKEQGWRFCIVGGLAVPAWGEPRATQDVDICLFTGLGSELEFIRPMLAVFRARIDSAAEFAELNRVLLIKAANEISIDVALAWTPFEEHMIERAVPFALEHDAVLPMASAEDLVITKAFAGRPQDWSDVTGILVRQRGKLDWKYIYPELSVLCELKESPETVHELERIRARIDAE